MLLDIYERVDARERRARPPLPHRARAAPRAGRHPALRAARRHREHAAVPRDRRRPLGRAGASARARSRRPTRSARCSTRGATLAFGSDWFVAPPTPLEGIYAAVTRRTLDDKNPDGWVPEQKITVEEALRAYTSGAAYASFEEKREGHDRGGQARRSQVIDRDLREIPPEEIRNAKIVRTIVGGKTVYDWDNLNLRDSRPQEQRGEGRKGREGNFFFFLFFFENRIFPPPPFSLLPFALEAEVS